MKRTLSILLMLLLLVSGARAEFAPAATALATHWRAGGAVLATVTMDIAEWKAVSEHTLGAVNSWLSAARMDLWLAPGASHTALTLDDQLFVSLRADTLADGREALTLMPDSLGLIAGSGSAWSQLLGSSKEAAPWHRQTDWPLAWEQLSLRLPGVYQLLIAHEKTVRQGISIKNVGKGKEKKEYALTADEWNAAWPAMVKALEPAILEGNAFPALARDALLAALKGLRFEKAGVLKRFIDADGADIGMQFTGTVSLAGEDVRKVTLYGGYNGQTGLYLSLKLPAVKGRNNLTLLLSSQWKSGKDANTFRLSYSLKRVVDSAVTAEEADINLKHQSASGRITGRAVISATPTGKAADRTALTLKPDLTAQGDALRGTAEVMVKQGRKQAFRGTISLSLQPGVLPVPASPNTTLDLERLDAASLDAARNTLADAMAKHLKTLLMRLDRAERLKVLHDIGRDARTEGPVAPLTDLALPDQQQPDNTTDYVVDKEDTP